MPPPRAESNVFHEFSHRLVSTHSPEPVELSVQTLAANVETRKTVVKNRERFPMVSKTRFTRSLNITVPNGGEGTRPASRLRDRALRTPRACFSFPSPFYLLRTLYSPYHNSFPATRRRFNVLGFLTLVLTHFPTLSPS